ncbi:MAG: DUF1538 domain-containing protein [Dehalococcoidales bacterium]|nr:DUF1538 domain-containing protein [Dehalococcoidales bacterium]
MLRIFRDTTQEVLKALLPIIIAIIVLQFTVLRMPPEVFLRFLIGSAMVIVGVVCFLYGVRTGILPIGRDVGAVLPQSGSIILVIAVALVFGFAVTYAEPGVMVLSKMSAEAGNSNTTAFIFVVAGGIAILFMAALLRILLGFPTRNLLAIVYGMVIILAMFTPPDFLAVAFDAGAAAAGPFTVPMLLALGLGFVSVLARRSPLSDGFGLIGIACAGPIIGILLWGVFFF